MIIDSSPKPRIINGKVRFTNNNGVDYKEILDSIRNWSDGSQYLNLCAYCDKEFFGNKYRVRCKECARGEWC
jgi:hypothetical protein